jgi:protein-disulfide isomerase
MQTRCEENESGHIADGSVNALRGVTTGLVIHRELLAGTTGPALAEQKTEFIEVSRDMLGHGVGSPTAKVQLIEFADFECPFCATFPRALKDLRERYPGDVALSYVHSRYPCIALQSRLLERPNAPLRKGASRKCIPCFSSNRVSSV